MALNHGEYVENSTGFERRKPLRAVAGHLWWSSRARRRQIDAMGGPYSGSSSLAAFIRVGAVGAGLTYGIVVNGFTGLFGRSSAKK